MAWLCTCLIALNFAGYKLENRTWAAKSPEEKESVARRKAAIQESFRRELALLVDVPKQGAGNTDDGNAARKFFSNASITSRITGVNEEFIERMDVILRAIACPYEIDVTAFRRYSLETARLYQSLYPWFYMPPSVHKILIHGADIISASPLPIGTYKIVFFQSEGEYPLPPTV